MGLLELTLLAAMAVAIVAVGRLLYLRHSAARTRDAAEATLKEMLGDPIYSERSFDVLSMSIESEDDEVTRGMLREIGARRIEDQGGRELWRLPSVATAGAPGKAAMPSA